MATEADADLTVRMAPYARERGMRASANGSGTRKISKVPYLPGLDGMRALAVVAVMVYHANSEWLPGGFLGVEVFFVISGYLITLLLIAERERSGRVNLGQFWIRRARRLLPALFLMMLLLIIYTSIFRSEALGQLRGDVLGGFFYVSNWYQIWVGQGYSASGDFAPLRHLWSLAVEEQFYLVWPIVMALLLRVGSRRIFDVAKWLVLAALAITVATAVLIHPGQIGECDVTPDAYWTIGERCISKADALYLSTITRAGGLLLGAAFAMIWRPLAIMRSPLRHKGRLFDLLAVVGVFTLGALTWWIHFIHEGHADPWLFRGGFLLTGIASLMVIAAVTHRQALAGPVLGNPVFLWVGTRSYGLYLYHWPIYQIIRKVAGNPLTFNQFVVAMVATAAITEASYRFVETPIRKGVVKQWWDGLRRSRDPAPRQFVLVGGATFVAFSLFGAASMATAELEQNELAQILDENEDAITDLGAVVGTTPTVDTVAPTVPGQTVAPNTQPPDGTVATDGSVPAQETVPTETAAPGATTAPEPTATTVAPATTTTAAPQVFDLLAIGDSVMQGAASKLQARGFVVDAQQSRQLKDMIPIVQGLRDRGQLGTAVVVHLGTNGPISHDSLGALLDALSGVPQVVLLTLDVPRSWEAANNEVIIAAQSRPNVKVLYWGEQTSQCPGDCFADDGFHLNSAGADYYTALIAGVLGL